MADETKNPGDGKTAEPPVDPLTLAALNTQIGEAHSKLAQLNDAFVELQKRLDEGPTQLASRLAELAEMCGDRFDQVERALVPVAAVAVEVWPNVCYSDPGLSQTRIKAVMGPINLRVAKSREMQTEPRPRVLPGEEFDPHTQDGRGVMAPDRSAPNYAPGFEPGAPPKE